MKKLVLILSVFFLTIISATAQDGQKNMKAVIKTTLYCDHFQGCETGSQNLDANIRKIKGVRMHEVDTEKNTITVYYNGKKTNLTEIKTAISLMGFDADDVKANEAAYAKLDDCCRKG